MTDKPYLDESETSNPRERETRLFTALPQVLADAVKALPVWRERLAGFDPRSITDRAALAALPLLRKDELMQAQAASPPWGGFADMANLQGCRVFVSPGPVWEPQPPGSDPWGAARALYAAGIRKGDIVHNSYAHHLTPGGFMMDEGARALGALVFPAGTGNTDQQVEAAAQLRPAAFCGTPDFLKILLDRAEEAGRDLSSIRKALVSGGALFPSLRAEYRERGIQVMQAYATADLGVIAYETSRGGEILPGMVCNEGLIVEIVRTGTGEPAAPGEVGEVVVTNLNPLYPLIRFATGDLSRFLEEPSPCGRTNLRIAGWMGRADQRTKVRGMFVDPAQIAALLKSAPEVARARLVVTRPDGRDRMVLRVLPRDGARPDSARLAEMLAASTKVRGGVEVVTDLPNDGKVIDDQRDYTK